MALAVAGFAPAPAEAAVNCQFDSSSGELGVMVSAGSPQVSLQRAAGGNDIKVFSGSVSGTPVVCAGGPPEMDTTESIRIDESASQQTTTYRIDLANGPLAPGILDEGDGSSEIELEIDDGGGPGLDTFIVNSSTAVADDSIRFGATPGGIGANLNGAESDPDADAQLSGIDIVQSDTFGGDDTLTADGSGAGEFTGPAAGQARFSGGPDDDVLRTGTGGGSISGDAGEDEFAGGAGADFFNPGDGDDVAEGGGSADSVTYLNQTQGVEVDLRVSAPQNTASAGIDTISGFENLVGGNAADTLIGTDGPNVLVGGHGPNDTGDDTLNGLGGNDSLNGAPGDDLLIGGPDNDTLTGTQGNDTAGYESATGPVTVSLAPSLTGTAQPTGGAGSDVLVDNPSAGDPDSAHEIESIVGGQFADTLTGNDGPNRIVGGDGADTISLLGGADQFDVVDGGADAVDCGDGGDEGTADAASIETVTACESVTFAPEPPAGGGDGGGGGDEPDPPADGGSEDPIPDDGGETEPPTADTDPPETTIAKVKVKGSTARVRLSADEAGARFECRIDRGAFRACGTSRKFRRLDDGRHRVEARAVDASGNVDPTAARRKLRIG